MQPFVRNVNASILIRDRLAYWAIQDIVPPDSTSTNAIREVLTMDAQVSEYLTNRAIAHPAYLFPFGVWFYKRKLLAALDPELTQCNLVGGSHSLSLPYSFIIPLYIVGD